MEQQQTKHKKLRRLVSTALPFNGLVFTVYLACFQVIILKEGQIEMARNQVADNYCKLVVAPFTIGYSSVCP